MKDYKSSWKNSKYDKENEGMALKKTSNERATKNKWWKQLLQGEVSEGMTVTLKKHWGGYYEEKLREDKVRRDRIKFNEQITLEKCRSFSQNAFKQENKNREKDSANHFGIHWGH